MSRHALHAGAELGLEEFPPELEGGKNAKKALAIANRAYVLETGTIATSGDADALMNDDAIKKAYLGE